MSDQQRAGQIPVECYFSGIEHETDKAWLVKRGRRPIWLPKSLCELIDDNGDCAGFLVPEWLARRKNLVID